MDGLESRMGRYLWMPMIDSIRGPLQASRTLHALAQALGEGIRVMQGRLALRNVAMETRPMLARRSSSRAQRALTA